MAPIEWLRSLRERPDGYRSLLGESGSFSVAAWRMAKARCQSQSVWSEVPSRSELRAAALELATRLGLGEVPPSYALMGDCEAQGLLVI